MPDFSQSRSLRKKIVFRFLAVLVGLSSLLVAEGALRLTGLGRIDDIGDPFVGFSQTVPLFVLDEDTQRYVIPKSRQVFFQPDEFAANKRKDEFRIFCLGGSTVQGRPYSIETSFTTWLELNLRAADPTQHWQVVNCGGVSYASYRLLPIMKEVVQYEPDLLIVYTGHNEFLEERSYSNIKRQPQWSLVLQSRMARSRIYGILWKLFRAESKATPAELPTEVDALLDYQGGLAKYHRDDKWRDGVVQHYSHNIRRMTHLARVAGVRLLLINPISNIRDTAPFKAETARQLTQEQQAEFARLWQLAKDSTWDDLPSKLQYVRAALNLDDRHAEAHFLQAKVYEAMGQPRAAKQAYLRAKDEDICPLRMLECMHDDLRTVAKQARTPLLDVRAALEETAEFGILGEDQLIDHVHPRIEQHQRIADLILQHLVDRGVANLQSGWEQRQAELFRANYESLADNYFPLSVERLRGLQRWARGRVTRLKLADKARPGAADE